jgi:hypothetical protein
MMKFKFYKENGEIVEIDVKSVLEGYSCRFENEVPYLNNILKKCEQPIKFEITQKIFKDCDEYAQKEYEYALKVTMDAPNSSTAQCPEYRRLVRMGKEGDDDYDALSRVMAKLENSHNAAEYNDPLSSNVLKYLQAISERVKDYRVFARLLHCAMSNYSTLDLNRLFEKEDSLNSLSKMDAQQLTDCIASLNKLCLWIVNDQPKIVRSWNDQDHIAHKKELYKIFIRYFNDRFNNIDIEERFLCASELYFMVCTHQKNADFLKTRGMIENALLNPENARVDRDIWSASVYLGGIETVLSSAAQQFVCDQDFNGLKDKAKKYILKERAENTHFSGEASKPSFKQ